ELGPIYGHQWRSWPGKNGESYDQLQNAINRIKEGNLSSHGMVVSAWNVSDLHDMRLPPCHMMYQFYVSPQDNTLSLQVFQRAGDFFLGVLFNTASYVLLTHMVAHATGHKVGELAFTITDARFYHNQLTAIEQQLKRSPQELPKLEIVGDVTDI